MPKKLISNLSRLLRVMFVVLFFQSFFVGFLTFCCFTLSSEIGLDSNMPTCFLEKFSIQYFILNSETQFLLLPLIFGYKAKKKSLAKFGRLHILGSALLVYDRLHIFKSPPD